MPTKVLLVNTAEETVKEARELTPPDFELDRRGPRQRRLCRSIGGYRGPAGQCQHHGRWVLSFRTEAAPRAVVQRRGQPHHFDAARRAGVLVSNSGGANSRAVAEQTPVLMLAVYRRLPWQHNAMTAGGRWRGNQPVPTFDRDAGQDAAHYRSWHHRQARRAHCQRRLRHERAIQRHRAYGRA